MATNNAAVGVVAAIAGSVAGWYGIRLIEQLLDRGVDAGVTAVANMFAARKSAPPGQYSPPLSSSGHPPSVLPPQSGSGYPPSVYPPAPTPTPAPLSAPGVPNYPPASAYGYPKYPPAPPNSAGHSSPLNP